MKYGELVSLLEQFSERRTAFRDARDYGTRIDQIAARLLKKIGADLRAVSFKQRCPFRVLVV